MSTRQIKYTVRKIVILTGLVTFSLAFFLVTGNGHAQVMTFEKSFDGNDDDWGMAVQQTSDGGYIIVGGTYEEVSGYGDVYLIKTYANGEITWTKKYGTGFWERCYSVKQTSDGGYILTGNTWSAGGGVQTDVYLLKTDANGDMLWSNSFGGDNWESSYSVKETDDGGYIIAGRTESFGPGAADGVPNVFLIKTDANGDALWTRGIGGSSWDEAFEVEQTTDGGYIVVGLTESFGAGERDVYLIKTDANGNEIWSKTYGDTDADEGMALQNTTDGGYIIAGVKDGIYNCCDDAGFSFLSSGKVYLIKTDATGDTLWTKTFGGTGMNIAHSVKQTGDGGYIITGETTSLGAGGIDVYLIRTDANGSTVWTTSFGGVFDDVGNSVQQTTDGGYVITGWTYSSSSGSEADVYLVKTTENPVSVKEQQATLPIGFELLQNYPNPFNPTTVISYSLDKSGKVELAVFNILGQQVATLFNEFQTAGQKSIAWSGLDDRGGEVTSGVYFYQLKAGNFQETKKMILLR